MNGVQISVRYRPKSGTARSQGICVLAHLCVFLDTAESFSKVVVPIYTFSSFISSSTLGFGPFNFSNSGGSVRTLLCVCISLVSHDFKHHFMIIGHSNVKSIAHLKNWVVFFFICFVHLSFS